MTVVGAAAAEEQAAKLGRLRWMDGKKGGCICNKKFTFTQLEKKKKVVEFRLLQTLLYWSNAVLRPKQAAVRNENTRRQGQPRAASLFVRTQQTKAQPMSTGRSFCVRTDTLLFAAHKKGFAKNKA